MSDSPSEQPPITTLDDLKRSVKVRTLRQLDSLLAYGSELLKISLIYGAFFLMEKAFLAIAVSVVGKHADKHPLVHSALESVEIISGIVICTLAFLHVVTGFLKIMKIEWYELK